MKSVKNKILDIQNIHLEQNMLGKYLVFKTYDYYDMSFQPYLETTKYIGVRITLFLFLIGRKNNDPFYALEHNFLRKIKK